MRSAIPVSLRRLIGGFFDKWSARRQKKKILRALHGDTVECNLCGWKGSRFADDHWHAETVCPVCRSQVRHRMFAAVLDGKSDIRGISEADLITSRDVLHFAPERQLRDRFDKAASRYVTADFERKDCEWRLDMSEMPEVADASFDTAIACDVLEHVPDDRAAMRELYRVLRPGGCAVVTVPQKDPPALTEEDPRLMDADERERRFGQKDHLRMFGDDFAQRLESAGFSVTVLSAENFERSVLIRHVLQPPEANPHPLATNHRRIYIARVRPG